MAILNFASAEGRNKQEIDADDLISQWGYMISAPGTYVQDRLRRDSVDIQPQLLAEIIRQTAEAPRPSLAYYGAIVDRVRAQKIFTLRQYEDQCSRRVRTPWRESAAAASVPDNMPMDEEMDMRTAEGHTAKPKGIEDEQRRLWLIEQYQSEIDRIRARRADGIITYEGTLLLEAYKNKIIHELGGTVEYKPDMRPGGSGEIAAKYRERKGVGDYPSDKP